MDSGHHTDIPSPTTPLASSSPILSALNEYGEDLKSIVSYISRMDLELLLLMDENIAALVSELSQSLWKNAKFLHGLLIQFFSIHEHGDASFPNVNNVENLCLSLEGLSPTNAIKESKMTLSKIYSTIFERIDFLLDSSIIHRDNLRFSSKASKEAVQLVQLDDGSMALSASFDQAVPRPQLTFYDAPCDNSREAQFSPRPESVKLGAPFSQEIESLLSAGEPLYKLTSVAHHFASMASDSLKNPSYEQMEERPLIFIDTLSQLKSLIDHLNSTPIFAIDVEYHSLRSFRGFSCLIQISTSTADAIIDALALREHLFLLNVPFGNASKLKIFHGCRQDLLWLQKDFSVFVVGIFDTFIAATAVLSLPLPSYSLASLVSTFCSKPGGKLEMDKELQLADWRIRPLSKEMIRYARADTYFLLSLFANLVIANSSGPEIVKGWIEWCIRESSSLASIRYSPENKDSSLERDRHDALINAQKSLNVPLSAPSIRAFNALWTWRDNMARVEDESTRYVLPTFMLIRIAQRVPSDSQSVLSCCNPVPPLLRQHSSDIAFLIWKAASDIETIVSSPSPMGHINEVKDILPIFSDECLARIKETAKQLADETNAPPSPMINVLSFWAFVDVDQETASKVAKIKGTFTLLPWALIEDERSHECAPECSADINATSLPLSTETDPLDQLEDLSEIEILKKKKKKKPKKPNAQEFINSTMELQNDPIPLLPSMEDKDLAPISPSYVSTSASPQSNVNLKRLSYRSDAIEVPAGYVSQKKHKRLFKGTSQSFLN